MVFSSMQVMNASPKPYNAAVLCLHRVTMIDLGLSTFAQYQAMNADALSSDRTFLIPNPALHPLLPPLSPVPYIIFASD
jgi:hypothetical protein